MTNLGVVETKRFTVLDISDGSKTAAAVPAKKEVKPSTKVEEKKKNEKKDVSPPASGEFILFEYRHIYHFIHYSFYLKYTNTYILMKSFGYAIYL